MTMYFILEAFICEPNTHNGKPLSLLTAPQESPTSFLSDV